MSYLVKLVKRYSYTTLPSSEDSANIMRVKMSPLPLRPLLSQILSYNPPPPPLSPSLSLSLSLPLSLISFLDRLKQLSGKSGK